MLEFTRFSHIWMHWHVNSIQWRETKNNLNLHNSKTIEHSGNVQIESKPAAIKLERKDEENWKYWICK